MSSKFPLLPYFFKMSFVKLTGKPICIIFNEISFAKHKSEIENFYILSPDKESVSRNFVL